MTDTVLTMLVFVPKYVEHLKASTDSNIDFWDKAP